jgi:hypothetical protein
MVERAHHHDLLVDARVLEEGLVERHPPSRVELGVERTADEPARQLAVFRAQRVAIAQQLGGEVVEREWRIERHAGLHGLDENHSLREGRAEPGRDVEALLRVERIVVVAAERHERWGTSSPSGRRSVGDRGAGVGGAPPPRSA